MRPVQPTLPAPLQPDPPPACRGNHSRVLGCALLVFAAVLLSIALLLVPSGSHRPGAALSTSRILVRAAATALAPAAPAEPAIAATAARRRLARLVGHNKTLETCRIASYSLQEEQHPGAVACASAGGRWQPFTGCLTDDAEAELFETLLAGKKVSDLRCGFMDAASRAWLADVHSRFAPCTLVVYTVLFGPGSSLYPTDHVVTSAAGARLCFVAFVDSEVVRALGVAPAVTTGPGRIGVWELVETVPERFSDSTPRSAHLLRALPHRLFPQAVASFYLDAKVQLPADPRAVLAAAATSRPRAAIAVVLHELHNRDAFIELLAVMNHLATRRLGPDWVRNGSVNAASVSAGYRHGIRGRDFTDVHRTAEFYAEVGFPLHNTGMLDGCISVWDHRPSCTAALACTWANRMAAYSMRTQLNFHYVVSMLGLHGQVARLAGDRGRTAMPPFFHGFNATRFSLEPTGWPAWGEAAPDTSWRRQRRAA